MKTMRVGIWFVKHEKQSIAPESQNIDKYQINGKVVNPDPERGGPSVCISGT